MASKFIVLIFCLYFSAFNSSEPATTDKPIAIQIEVDIEPPADTDGLNGDQLARLGLPAHHVHYRAGQPAGSELLAPEDIQVSYTLKEEEEENGPETDITGANRAGIDALFIVGGIHGALVGDLSGVAKMLSESGAQARALMPALSW